MMAYIVRIRMNWVRKLLVSMVFPVAFIPIACSSVQNGRVRQADFWKFHWKLYLSACGGRFVYADGLRLV